MEIEKLIDIKILCGQVIEKVNELLEVVDADKVDIKSLSENTKLRTDETEFDEININELSDLSKYQTQDELLDESIKNGVDAVLATDEDEKLKKSFDSIMNTVPVKDDFSDFSEKADEAIYKSDDEKLNEAIEVSNIIINDSIVDKAQDISYSEIANSISETIPDVEE